MATSPYMPTYAEYQAKPTNYMYLSPDQKRQYMYPEMPAAQAAGAWGEQGWRGPISWDAYNQFKSTVDPNARLGGATYASPEAAADAYQRTVDFNNPLYRPGGAGGPAASVAPTTLGSPINPATAANPNYTPAGGRNPLNLSQQNQLSSAQDQARQILALRAQGGQVNQGLPMEARPGVMSPEQIAQYNRMKDLPSTQYSFDPNSYGTTPIGNVGELGYVPGRSPTSASPFDPFQTPYPAAAPPAQGTPWNPAQPGEWLKPGWHLDPKTNTWSRTDTSAASGSPSASTPGTGAYATGGNMSRLTPRDGATTPTASHGESQGGWYTGSNFQDPYQKSRQKNPFGGGFGGQFGGGSF